MITGEQIVNSFGLAAGSSQALGISPANSYGIAAGTSTVLGVSGLSGRLPTRIGRTSITITGHDRTIDTAFSMDREVVMT